MTRQPRDRYLELHLQPGARSERSTVARLDARSVGHAQDDADDRENEPRRRDEQPRLLCIRLPTVAQVRAAAFVGLVAYDGGKYVPSTDDCPLRLGERTVASEVGTMALALLVASESGHLLFGPVIAARRELEAGALVELRVPGWNVTEEPFLACDAERVLTRDQTAILEAMRAALATGPQPRVD